MFFILHIQIIWQPYTPDLLAQLPDYCLHGQEIWCSRVPLICFYIIEWHYTDRVTRQFGIVQSIPDPCDTDATLHRIDLRGRPEQDWSVTHHRYIKF